MATFVIVHGAWGGGFEWAEVARALRAGSHEVLTPTLTGLGERAHLEAHPPVGLGTHVADVVATCELEDLDAVVLCGASYGGLPVTGAADRIPERVRAVVYVDALVPTDGQRGLDLLPPAFAQMVTDGLTEHGPAWRIPMPPELLEALLPTGSLPEERRVAVGARTRPHPVGCFTEPVRLTGRAEHLPRAFLRCTAGRYADELGGDPIEAGAARARAAGWAYRELDAPHDPQLFAPEATAALLAELAAELG